MKKLPAPSVYYIRCAAWEFNSGLIFTSIWVLYYSVMELDLLQVSFIFIVSTISNLVLEVPTGLVADVYSRRLSVIIGGMLIGTAFITVGAFPLFLVAMLAAFIEAAGDTFVSGALQAWITDETGTDRVAQIFLRGRQVGIPAHWLGVAGSIALAAVFNYQVPIVLGGALWLALSIFLILFMPEVNFQRKDLHMQQQRVALLSQFRVTLGLFGEGMQLVRGSRILLLLFVAQFFSRAFADSFYKFSRAHILRSFSLPVLTLPLIGELKENVWFGMLEMLQGLCSLVGMEGIRRKINLNRPGMAAQVLLGVHLLMLGGGVAFAVTGNFFLAVVAWLVVSSLQQIGNPVTETWLNQHIPSSIRSTVLSMSSQIGLVGQLGGGPALSLVGDRFGVRSALGLASLLLAPLVVLYQRSQYLPAETFPSHASGN